MPSSNKEHWFKWVVIGFLSAIGLVCILVAVLVFMFTPLIKVDETTGRIQLFGGIIDMQAKNVITSLSKNNSFVFGSIEGVERLGPETKSVAIKFGAGEMRIDYNNGGEINWDCDGAGKNVRLQSSSDDSVVSIDFSSAFVDCDVTIPAIPLKIVGMSGEVDVRKIQADVEIKLEKGDVLLGPIPGQNYVFELKAGTGSVDPSFTNSPNSASEKASPVKVKVDLRIGDIQRLD